MSSNVKKLEVMLISQILLEDYRGHLSLEDNDVSNMLVKRMQKNIELVMKQCKKLLVVIEKFLKEEGMKILHMLLIQNMVYMIH